MQITTPEQYTYETIAYRLDIDTSYVQFKVKACHDAHLGTGICNWLNELKV